MRGRIVLSVGAALALALAILMSSASAALARGQAVPVRAPVADHAPVVAVADHVPVIAETHTPAVKLSPAVIAHAAGHKIA